MPVGGLVSVVIPTYNRAGRVAAAVDSVLAQDYPEIEILVVDDGSTDDTRARMAAFYGSNPKVRCFPKANGGVSSARNLGIRESRGAYVAFLDADDVWLPGKISLQLECLLLFPRAGMVWTDMAAVDADGKIVHERYLRRMYSAYEDYPTPRDLFAKELQEARIGDFEAFCGDIFSPMVLGNLVHTSTALLRRERLEKTGFFDESFRTGEDYPFHLNACRAGPVAYVDAPTVRYAIGLPDALTSPEKLREISLNFLRTLEATLANDRGRISLPAVLIRKRLAEAYGWAGDEHLDAGLLDDARGYFLKSLRTDPANISRCKSLLATLLPGGLRARLIGLKRGLRERLREKPGPD
ncbi:MAG: glycosyltransferase family 2 protein [Elusimicrobiota bacterium]